MKNAFAMGCVSNGDFTAGFNEPLLPMPLKGASCWLLCSFRGPGHWSELASYSKALMALIFAPCLAANRGNARRLEADFFAADSSLPHQP